MEEKEGKHEINKQGKEKRRKYTRKVKDRAKGKVVPVLN
jgi:hypothetical protein